MSEIKSEKSFYAILLGTTCLACLGTSSPALAEITISDTARIGLKTTDLGTGTEIVSSTGPVSVVVNSAGETALVINPKTDSCQNLSQVNCLASAIFPADVTNSISRRVDGGIELLGSGNEINFKTDASLTTGTANAVGISSVGDHVTVIMSGNITTTGSGSIGIRTRGQNIGAMPKSW